VDDCHHFLFNRGESIIYASSFQEEVKVVI
jgi:hypothetical protein